MPVSFAPLGRTYYFRHNKHWYRIVYEGRSMTTAHRIAEEYRSKGYTVQGLDAGSGLTHATKEYAVGIWKPKMRFRW